MAVVAPQVQVLVNHSGTQWDPVRGVRHVGITYQAAADTYMEPHGVPSAGDWALDRYGAMFLEGTEGVVVDNCTFDRLDGNAVMVSGYNRNATITNSDFSYLGGNAVACWGYTNETKGDNHPHAGVDGTDGNHPRYTTVTGCTAREIGLYEKQSSFFVSAKAAQSVVLRNVFFNGPRAGINFNDGFGGGDEIGYNLVFSTCRESGDHGPLNSWDRQPFLTTVRTGEPSMIPAWRGVHNNFFIDNYAPQEDVDNDDGSSYYHTHDNFFIYGGRGIKADFGGHDNRHQSNVYAYVGCPAGDATIQDAGHECWFTDNRVVMTGFDVGYLSQGVGAPPGAPNVKCQQLENGTSTKELIVIHNNSYFTSNASVFECGYPLSEWQAAGYDQGSTAGKTPSDDTIIGWGKEKLAMQ